MGDFNEAIVINVIKMFQLPSDVEGDMDGPGADGEGWGDIALQGVANHQELRGVYLLVFAQRQEFTLRLVRGDLHIVEIVQQT